MNPTLREKRSLFINDFLEAERARVLAQELRAYFAGIPLFTDGQCPNSPAVYNFLPLVELLLEKLPFVSERAGACLFPTFCYARSYTHGERLEPHRDRPASEVSVTVNLDGDHAWPIFFGHPLTGIKTAVLEPGQAVIYLGCEITHWREPFPGQSYQQMFLHYVRSRGKYATACFDNKTPEINGIRY
ncbi:MAG: hypothetical protein M3416_00875 [Acidobacteriota bacterium]|nr:hypothetical protein [Acidobacteriota bacterium]